MITNVEVTIKRTFSFNDQEESWESFKRMLRDVIEDEPEYFMSKGEWEFKPIKRPKLNGIAVKRKGDE